MHALAARAALLGLLGLRVVGLGPHVGPTPPDTLSPDQVAELWLDPGDVATLDLFNGPWGAIAAPDPSETFAFVSQKTAGFSAGYDVKDSAGTEWSVKMGPEAQTEVVASRIVAAMGYHQPPVYYVPQWSLSGGPSPGVQAPARFRPKLNALNTKGSWSWQRNPFVRTQPYRGLLALMVLLNSSDLRNQNNVVYEVKDRGVGDDRHRWYVVRDLGASLGQTGVYRPRRNYLEGFETEPFIRKVKNGQIEFGYRGLEHELVRQISPEDLRWTCERLGRFSSAQWHDAFRAGGYPGDVADRYIAVIQERIRTGEALSRS